MLRKFHVISADKKLPDSAQKFWSCVRHVSFRERTGGAGLRVIAGDAASELGGAFGFSQSSWCPKQVA